MIFTSNSLGNILANAHCSGCGKKSHFINTKKFRVNANGNRLNVWLIYQCENCRHTLNHTIYERQKASSIPEKEYRNFLKNDEGLAELYGTNTPFFKKNKTEIDFERLPYDFIPLHNTTEPVDYSKPVLFTIQNPCELKIRPEKQLAEALGLSRNQVQKFMLQGKIKLKSASSKMICGIVQVQLYV